MNEFQSLIVGGTMLVFILVSAIIIFLFLLQKRHFWHQQEKEKLQQELLRVQIEVQQQTLQHVSQELHDNIGQLLSIIKISLNTIEESPELNPHQDRVIRTNELVSRVINDLRDLSKGLNADFVEKFGLAGCIIFELERLANTTQYKTQFTTSHTPYTLPLANEFVVYRVVQELLNNIIKHAAASNITINMVYNPEELIISVIDDGRGFEQDAAGSATQSGLGMGNMKKRLELVGGRLVTNSSLNLGTQSDIVVPRSVKS